MLIQLLIQQPQMLGPIIQRTPAWVWALLAGLLWLGASQLRARQVGLVRALATPLAMTGLSVYGVASAFGPAGQAAVALGSWFVAAAALAALALWFQPTPPAGTEYLPQARSFCVPGSAMPLALILGIFLTKYFVGVELALQPTLASSSEFALQIGTLYGVFNGLFAARALRLWRLAQGHGALQATAIWTRPSI
ncbi:MAG: hypothetical protein LWW96_01500 [Acidovorax sp.]|uniref:DUF6622 family protein n=1 Tax=Acidovorax sp. TaxID=1872122 RepID=UPI0025C22337|nr:DUF6622 family protein [Acidovorax sp.]MCE1190806.1 hypothetical protein [Acidovorax sp.]